MNPKLAAYIICFVCCGLILVPQIGKHKLLFWVVIALAGGTAAFVGTLRETPLRPAWLQDKNTWGFLAFCIICFEIMAAFLLYVRGLP